MPEDSRLLTIVNKTDLNTPEETAELSVRLQALTGTTPLTPSATQDHPDRLRKAIHKLSAETLADASDVIVANSRHYEALHNAIAPLTRVLAALQPTPYPLPSDLIAQDVRESIHHLSTITGAITAPDILTTIFSRFCIGK